ncbi:hypothetical protein PINS_up007446 [Pythium insidiosum]|nr:hypothetical protein PINS_up007446 [Pythium insidiosum]
MDRLQELWCSTSREITTKMKATTGDAAEKLRQEAELLRSKAREATERVKDVVEDKTKEAAEKIKDTVHDTKARTKVKAAEVGSTISQNLKANQEHLSANLRKNAEFLKESAKGTAESLLHKAEESIADVSAGAKERAHLLKERSVGKMSNVTDHASEKLRASMVDGAQKVRESSAALVENLDPRARARKIRNRWLMLGFSAVAIYGFASAAPDAMAKYALEKVKIQEEKKAQRSES